MLLKMAVKRKRSLMETTKTKRWRRMRKKTRRRMKRTKT